MLTFGTNQSVVLTGVNHAAPHAGALFTLLTFIDRQKDRPIVKLHEHLGSFSLEFFLCSTIHPRGNHPSSDF